MKKLSIALLSSAAALMSATAYADESFYGSLNLARTDIDIGIAGVDDTDTTFGFGAGYRLNENFAIELGYQDFGEISVSSAGASASVEADAIQLSVIGGVPVSENAGVYAELGFDSWDADLTYTNVPGFGTGSESEDGTDIFYGIGAYMSLSETVDLKFEYQLHELDGTDVDILGLGFTVSF
ncbi:MAG: porin family protein [Pseudomonadales bacterium]